MKLKLRKFTSVIVLHVSGVVQPHDAEVLSVGAAKISDDELPLILNLEEADLSEEAVAHFETLYDRFSKLERVCLIVSPKLPAADASTFEEALTKSKNPRKDVILRCLRLEDALSELEEEEERLSKRIKELELEGKSHFEFLREKNTTDFMLTAMNEAIGGEYDRIVRFKSNQKSNPAFDQRLEELKAEALALFKEKGVPIG